MMNLTDQSKMRPDDIYKNNVSHKLKHDQRWEVKQTDLKNREWTTFNNIRFV